MLADRLVLEEQTQGEGIVIRTMTWVIRHPNNINRLFPTFSTQLALLSSVLLLTGCGEASLEKPSWETFRDQFMEETFVANPSFAVYQGRHEFDGKLPDWSPAGLQREVNRLKSSRDQALAFDPADLDAQQGFERDFLVSVIDQDLFWLESAEAPYRNPTFYSGSVDPNVYIMWEYAPLDVRMRAFIDYARALPPAAEQIKKNLRTPLPRTFVQIGRINFGGLASYFEEDVPAVFADVENEELQAEFQVANHAAIQAMKDLDAWFLEHEEEATDDFQLGPELFSKMLYATERVDLPLDQLEEIGKRDLERNLAALGEACADFAAGKSIADCVARVQANKPEGGPVEGADTQLQELRQFVVDHEMVTIPGSEEVFVEEAPPYLRWNFAFINIPGPYEKALPSIYYIAPPDPGWSEQEQQAYIPGKADLLFVSVHEVWPGHFLQFLHSNRSSSRFGQVFVGYAFAEGWAHYTEELMWEAGLAEGDREVHIGQLLNALLRNVRFLSAIGLHTGKMTVEESERMFRETAYQDAGNARQQAARGTFDPAYLNYTMGKLMIRKLRQDWTSTRGEVKAWRDFHDQFLSYGGPPIPLVRRAMLGADSGSLF